MKSGAETFGGEPRVPLSGERGGGCGVRRRQTFFTVSVVLISAPPSCGNPTTWNSAAKTEIGWLSSSPNEIFAVPPAQAEEEATSVGADIIAPGAQPQAYSLLVDCLWLSPALKKFTTASRTGSAGAGRQEPNCCQRVTLQPGEHDHRQRGATY